MKIIFFQLNAIVGRVIFLLLAFIIESSTRDMVISLKSIMF